MERARTETAREFKVLEQLIVNEAQLPIDWKWRRQILKVWNRWLHIKANLQLWRMIRISNHGCRQGLDLRDENLSRFNGAAEEEHREKLGKTGIISRDVIAI